MGMETHGYVVGQNGFNLKVNCQFLLFPCTNYSQSQIVYKQIIVTVMDEVSIGILINLRCIAEL